MTWMQCTARLTLTTAELADLAAIAGAVHLPKRELRCDLQDQHGALHMAMAQAYSGPFGHHERWIRWGGGTRELVVYREDEMCEQEVCSPSFPEDWTRCCLPAGHEGGDNHPGVTGGPPSGCERSNREKRACGTGGILGDLFKEDK